jgi:hypothetical protein
VILELKPCYSVITGSAHSTSDTKILGFPNVAPQVGQIRVHPARLCTSFSTVRCNRLLGAAGSGARSYALADSAETGRSNSGLKNRLPRAARMIGVKPTTTAWTSRPVLPITPAL